MVYKAAEGGTPPFRKAIGREDIPPHCRKAMGQCCTGQPDSRSERSRQRGHIG